MCLFSGRQRALRVAKTRIFARVDGERQCLVYSMHLASSEDVAMILPVPVAVGAGEDAMAFVDLSSYPTMFDDLAAFFGPPAPAFAAPQPRAKTPAKLVVHEVGAFVASFVPRLADFGRLDPRFRLPDTVWAQLPGYADWGFAVLQLARGDAKVHPMALHYPTRDRSRLYFPTTHVHDGAVHPQADFDHELYWQGPQEGHLTDVRSNVPLGATLAERSKGLAVNDFARRRVMQGPHANADVWI